jgi:hypothetical protein
LDGEFRELDSAVGAVNLGDLRHLWFWLRIIPVGEGEAGQLEFVDHGEGSVLGTQPLSRRHLLRLPEGIEYLKAAL